MGKRKRVTRNYIMSWTSTHVSKRVEGDIIFSFYPGYYIVVAWWMTIGWWHTYYLYLLFPKGTFRGSCQRGPKCNHLVHPTYQAHTSLFHNRPDDIFSSSDMSSFGIFSPLYTSYHLERVRSKHPSRIPSSNIVGGNSVLTCSSYHQRTCLNRTLLEFSNLHALSKYRGRVPQSNVVGGGGQVLDPYASSEGRCQASRPPHLW